MIRSLSWGGEALRTSRRWQYKGIGGLLSTQGWMEGQEGQSQSVQEAVVKLNCEPLQYMTLVWVLVS